MTDLVPASHPAVAPPPHPSAPGIAPNPSHDETPQETQFPGISTRRRPTSSAMPRRSTSDRVHPPGGSGLREARRSTGSWLPRYRQQQFPEDARTFDPRGQSHQVVGGGATAVAPLPRTGAKRCDRSRSAEDRYEHSPARTHSRSTSAHHQADRSPSDPTRTPRQIQNHEPQTAHPPRLHRRLVRRHRRRPRPPARRPVLVRRPMANPAGRDHSRLPPTGQAIRHAPHQAQAPPRQWTPRRSRGTTARATGRLTSARRVRAPTG